MTFDIVLHKIFVEHCERSTTLQSHKHLTFLFDNVTLYKVCIQEYVGKVMPMITRIIFTE